MLASLSPGTIKQYGCCYKKWFHFCNLNSLDPYVYNLKEFVEYFLELHTSGSSYATLNTNRSALSLLFTIPSQDESIIKRLLKGTYNLNPSAPKYRTTWDPAIVLAYLEKLFPLQSLSLEQVTYKLVTLMALTSAHRVQTLSKVTLDNISLHTETVEIQITARIKTSTVNRPQPYLIFPYFKEKPELCTASTIAYYMRLTEQHRPRGEKQLILTHKKPFRAASTQTISRWIKTILRVSGVDTRIFSGHSTRHAATSAAHRAGVSIDIIKQTAGWTHNSDVFNKFYNRPLTTDTTEFANCIIAASGNNRANANTSRL